MSTRNYEKAYKLLVKGLTELDLRGPIVPSELILIGDQAFPVVMNSQGKVLMAASQYGQGRIVVLGHDGYLEYSPALVENALNWLRGDTSLNLSVGFHQNVRNVAYNLSSTFEVHVVTGFTSTLEVGVYVTDAYSVGENPKDLVAYMKAGGGVLIAGQGCCWYQRYPGSNPMLNFDGNKVSGVAGIYFSEIKGWAEIVPITEQVPYSWTTLKMGMDFDDDLKFLLQDVTEFDVSGGATFSEILVHSPMAFPIGTTEDGLPFLAGAYYGLGRVLVISHEGHLSNEKLATFWANAIRWLDQGRHGVVGIVQANAIPVLSKSGLKCERTSFSGDLSVFVNTAYSDANAKEIQDFVAEGGGLLIGGHAWYWSYSGGNVMTEFPGNKVLNKLGLSLLANTIDGGVYPASASSQAIKDNYFYRHLLYCFAGHIFNGTGLKPHELEGLKRLSRDCSTYLQMKAYDWPSYTQVVSALTGLLMKAGMPQVSESNPLKIPKDHFLLSIGSMLHETSSNPDDLLPLLIKDIPLLPVVTNQKIKINVNTAGGVDWISTGLYLSPGMKTNLTLPAVIVNKGWKVQIGCQTDHLNHNELMRPPSVCKRVPITSEMMQVKNLWGGLIYLLAPAKTQVTGVEVIVQQAVLAPYYKSGVTTASDWSLLRAAPSPWAELEFDNIILSVPSNTVRDLERPDELAALWNDIMKAVADLAVIPRNFPRKERIVTDVQISSGWMHAGYPIMGPTAIASSLVSVTQAKSGMWGPIHELGHNQQRSCWEFPWHTTECTCNLWSVYVHEEVLGIQRAQAHGTLTLENRKDRREKYVRNGRKLSDWSMWVALETYLELQERFGWDAFKAVFAGYHEMSNIPEGNDGKMNLYAKTFSRAVGMNLTGFFKAWGWPIEADTKEDLSHLPPWTDHPMAENN